MTGYRIFFIDREGHIKGREEFVAEDDTSARERAQELFSQQDAYSGFELWQEKRRVCVRHEVPNS